MTEPVRHVLVLADSLSFHGPERPERPDDPRLYPQVMGAALSLTYGCPVGVDLSARLGWTARDAWWAMTKDPRVWGVLLPRADALVIGVGQMDHLPAAIPTFWREGIAYVRPGPLRRRLRQTHQRLSPYVIRATSGRLRQLPQRATDHYLSRIVEAARLLRPGLPIAMLGPSPHASTAYPSHRQHGPAVAAARLWAERHGVALIDLDPIVAPSLAAGAGNPDGLHWSWDVHDQIGRCLAAALSAQPMQQPVRGRAAQPSHGDPRSSSDHDSVR